jgi:membrane protease YdiL (CAAX protease family)
VLSAVGLGVAPFALALARRLWPERLVFFARWGFTHLVLLVLVTVGASVAVGLLWPVPAEEEVGLLGSLGRMALMFSAVGLTIARLAQRLEPAPARALGFEAAGTPRAVGVGLVVYLLLLPGLMGVTFLWPSLLELMGEEPEPQAVLVGFLGLEGGQLVLAFVGATVVLPFFEELLFRGFLQPLLVQNFRDRGGVVLTSLVFAALHGLTAFLPIFALSLILGGLMLRTRRLASAWAVHALHNALMISLLLSVPELRDSLGEAGLLGLFLP